MLCASKGIRTETAALKSKRAVVNGIGIFHSWPRNFPNPRDAMFDLLDNAVDAATSDHQYGRISIAADDRSTGVMIINSCVAPVKPLDKVLELYTSEKQCTGAVGENGIGLKQGVVTLANVAFIISKNHSKYSLGIVAMCLQTKSECWMPSFEFEAEVGPELEQELFTTLDSQPRLRHCVSLYGDSFLDGVRRLLKVMLRMDNSKRGWRQYPHVFCLLLHDLKHGENLVPQDRVADFLEQTKADLPMHYLHIPKNLSITVDKALVQFNYWQPRLVEMTVFDFHINRSVPMEDDPWWQCPEKSYDPSKYYPIRVYMGFDAKRAADDVQRSTGSLHIYSRKCGRLIRVSPDARGEINVSNGGTDFCQGLTIIVDDRRGNLPLNPTKHDVAFSEHADGVIHRANLFCYINAVTRFYYNYFKECYFLKKKKEISDALKVMVPRVKEAIALAKHEYTPISLCKLNTFNAFLLKQTSVKTNRISRLLPWKDVVFNKGKDNILCFTKVDPPQAAAVPATSAVTPEPVVSATPPLPVRTADLFDDNNDHGILSTAASRGQRFIEDSPPASRNTAAMPDLETPVRKRARKDASEETSNEELVARVGALEGRLAKMEERMVTQNQLEKEIRRLKRDMARQDEVIARLAARLGNADQTYEC